MDKVHEINCLVYLEIQSPVVRRHCRCLYLKEANLIVVSIQVTDFSRDYATNIYLQNVE